MNQIAHNSENHIYEKIFENKVLAWRKNEVKDTSYDSQRMHLKAISGRSTNLDIYNILKYPKKIQKFSKMPDNE